ncbi:hypothetical protein ACQEUX_22365 [Micromonospora sp. CA-259024]|uniref:hypothetical protein n=1 Tax=Micromonospora sp. CA-259024 TaxID=3239965 RepID=UPI003D8F0C56
MPGRVDVPTNPPEGDDTAAIPPPSILARLRRARRSPVLLGVAVLLAGLTYATSIASYKWHLHTKAERLRAEGVQVQADVSARRDNSGRGGGTDTIRVGYDYEGVRYSERILCGSAGGCTEEPPTVMRVWVDPEHPEEFLAENGNTDDSVFVLNAWGGIPFGLVFAVVGGGLVWVATLPDRTPTRAPVQRGPGRDRVRRTVSARRRRRRNPRS